MAQILVIDDDAMVLEALKEGLESLGHEVFANPEGAAAAPFVGQQHIDVVITDLMMPNYNGFEVIDAIRAQNRNIKIIAITGLHSERGMEYTDMAERLGADWALQKPVMLDELDIVLQKWLN